MEYAPKGVLTAAPERQKQQLGRILQVNTGRVIAGHRIVAVTGEKTTRAAQSRSTDSSTSTAKRRARHDAELVGREWHLSQRPVPHASVTSPAVLVLSVETAFEPWCPLHRMRAWRHGDPRQPRSITWKDIEAILPLVQEYLRQNPPPADVLDRLYERVLSPSADFDMSNMEPHWTRTMLPGRSGLQEAKRKLRVLMAWWRSPESARNAHHHGEPQREAQATRNASTEPLPPWYVLRVLLAVEVFTTERQWGVGLRARVVQSGNAAADQTTA